jgi:hypothetical protein
MALCIAYLLLSISGGAKPFIAFDFILIDFPAAPCERNITAAPLNLQVSPY